MTINQFISHSRRQTNSGSRSYQGARQSLQVSACHCGRRQRAWTRACCNGPDGFSSDRIVCRQKGEKHGPRGFCVSTILVVHHFISLSLCVSVSFTMNYSWDNLHRLRLTSPFGQDVCCHLPNLTPLSSTNTIKPIWRTVQKSVRSACSISRTFLSV